MFKQIKVLFGVAVPFDKPERKLYMIYYGISIKSVFIGVGCLIDKNQTTFKPKNVLKIA